MKRALLALGFLWSVVANAQFVPGQLLTAAELNTQFALYAPLGGATFTGPVTIPTLTVTTTATLPAQSANTVLGNSTGSSASPTAVSVTNCAGTSSALNWTGGSGFSCNGSINALTLSGATFQSPGTIGGTSASPAFFTNLNANGTITFANGSLPLSYLATQAANTIVANATGSIASPTAAAIPSCSTAQNALLWTSGTGFGCNTTINAALLGGATFASPGTIGSTTANTGAFTTLSASSTVSGTGFSNYLASPPSIGGISPNSAQFTTINMTGTITPSQTSGIVGTNTTNNANAGSVGEYVTAVATTVAITTGTGTNVTSISLTAGDWDVEGVLQTNPAGTTTESGVGAGISTTSGAFGTLGTGFSNASLVQAAFPAGNGQTVIAPRTRISIASTTTVFLVGFVNYATSTLTVSGFIRARRVR